MEAVEKSPPSSVLALPLKVEISEFVRLFVFYCKWDLCMTVLLLHVACIVDHNLPFSHRTPLSCLMLKNPQTRSDRGIFVVLA